jgi:peptidoglycan/LPS O-acetylase OafA/YrhL
VNSTTSTYLDLVRFLAATAVFIDHLSSQKFSAGFLWQLEHLGDQAVIVFFVLSGFVIGYVTDTRERDVKTYALNRTARILSVALPALVLTFLLDSMGRTIEPSVYAALQQDARYPEWLQYAASALFLNEIWAAGISPGTNRVYWSLGYEVWYYIAFAAVVFAPARWRLASVGLAVVVVGPAIALLMPLWFLGVGLYYACKSPPSSALGLAALVGSAGLWLAYEVFTAPENGWTIATTTYFPRNEIPQDYLVALFFALNLYGFVSLSSRFAISHAGIERLIRWCAGATFSFYLTHLPLLHFFTAISPWPIDSAAHRFFLVIATLTSVFAFASVTERKKQDWRVLIERIAGTAETVWRRVT